MEVLTVFEQLCSPLAYNELITSFNKSDLGKILKKYPNESPDGTIPLCEQIYKLLTWITDNVLSINGSNYIEPEISAEDKQQIESLLSVFGAILSSIIRKPKENSTNEVRWIIKKTAPIALIVCASHIEHHQWTSLVTTNISKEILQLLCEGCQTKSISELLAPSTEKDENKTRKIFPNGVLNDVLEILLTRLTSWPALPYVSHWCITQVKYPNLGDHLAKLLTLVLKLTDSHQVSHKVVGVKCLHYVMKNSNAAELIWYGRCDVIYELLQRLFYLSEPELLEVVYPCILLSLQIIKTRDKDKMVKHYDKVLQAIFTTMEYESKQPLRRVHIRFLKDVVNQVGIHLLCYFTRFLDVVLSYLDVYDEKGEEIRINALQVLKTAMLHLWPRVGEHAVEIHKALLKLVVDCADIENTETKESLLDLCAKCLVVLYHCCPDYMKKSFHSLEAEVKHKEITYCIKKVKKELAS